MSEKFRNRYRIKSARAPWWDYGKDAAYFITICTKSRQHYFGHISNHHMQLSPMGVIADPSGRTIVESTGRIIAELSDRTMANTTV